MSGEKDPVFRKRLEKEQAEQRFRNARAIVILRCVESTLFFLYTLVFALLGRERDLQANLPLVGFYLAASFALAVVSHFNKRFLAFSWWIIPILDFPMIFWIQYRGLSQATSPAANAAFTVGLLAVGTLMTMMSMSETNIVITAAAGIILESILILRAGLGAMGIAATSGLLAFVTLLAIYNVRQIKSLVEGLLLERSRIARDIHDTIAQTLTGISLHLESLRETAGEGPAEMSRDIEKVRTLVLNSLAEARQSVWKLRSQTLEDSDLAAALYGLAEELNSRSSVRIHFKLSGSRRPLDPELEEGMLRVAQQALANALRHAQPRNVTIDLQYKQKQLRLRVKDDGVGFEVNELSSPGNEHFGLRGMRERTEDLGGSFNVQSRPGKGTEVLVVLPA